MLITDEYRALQERLHATNPDYGVASTEFAPLVAEVLKQSRPAELLDYGAGKGRLAKALGALLPFPLRVRNYDPAIPEWAAVPAPCEFVACIDVLEHVEPDLIENVLDDLKRVTLRFGFLTIHTGPAAKFLSDGRNAHLIQEPPRWWLPKIVDRFELLNYQRTRSGFWLVVERAAI
jgi:hypothetical protein